MRDTTGSFMHEMMCPATVMNGREGHSGASGLRLARGPCPLSIDAHIYHSCSTKLHNFLNKFVFAREGGREKERKWANKEKEWSQGMKIIYDCCECSSRWARLVLGLMGWLVGWVGEYFMERGRDDHIDWEVLTGTHTAIYKYLIFKYKLQIDLITYWPTSLHSHLPGFVLALGQCCGQGGRHCANMFRLSISHSLLHCQGPERERDETQFHSSGPCNEQLLI